MKPIFITAKSGKKLLVRPPESGDEKQLLNHINALIKEDTFIAMAGKPLSLKEEIAWLKSVLKKIQTQEATFLLVFDGSKLVANCGITKKLSRLSHIGDFGISVAEKYRKQGIGFQLANLVLKKARKIGIRIAILQVFSNNPLAQRLYQKLRFVRYGTLPKSLTHRDQLIDLIQMYLRLN